MYFSKKLVFRKIASTGKRVLSAKKELIAQKEMIVLSYKWNLFIKV